MRSVLIILFDEVQSLDVTGPLEVFANARDHAGNPAYHIRTASLGGTSIRTSSGLRITPDTDLAAAHGQAWDLLLFPGGHGARHPDPGLITWIRANAPRAARLASVCTGAFLLAEAGLLNGRTATTHWAYCGELAEKYPGVTVDPDPIFIKDGNLATSAGVTAGIDLALALLEDDLGRDTALATARHLVVFLRRPGGQSQFSARMTPRGSGHPVLRGVMDAIVADPAEAHHMDALALQAGVSTRHLSRLFRTEVGMTPGRYVELVRVEAAQALLTSGNDSVDAVAERSGFGSAESMRRSFQHIIGIAPTVYRARFRSTAAQGTRA